jgi:hypothetical protein
METFDVLLSDKDIATHLQESAALLTSQDVSLAFHESMLDAEVLFPLDVSAESGLDFPGSILSAEHAISPIAHFGDESLYLSLNHDKTLAFSSELSPLCV